MPPFTSTPQLRPTAHTAPLAPSYRHVAWAYDLLATAYSLGTIDRAKARHHRWVAGGDRLLYAGAGRGREIVGALHRGASVTCVEPCPRMSARLLHRTRGHAERIDYVAEPIQSYPCEPSYDLVLSHFFLNVFDPATMPRVLEHLTRFVKPSGRLVIADFMPAQRTSTAIDRLTRKLYHDPLNRIGRALRICAAHPIYDYAPPLTELGFAVESREPMRLIPGTAPLYEVIAARRVAAN